LLRCLFFFCFLLFISSLLKHFAVWPPFLSIVLFPFHFFFLRYKYIFLTALYNDAHTTKLLSTSISLSLSLVLRWCVVLCWAMQRGLEWNA